jgi:hypothetical protein
MRCSSWLTYKVHGWIQRFSRPFPCTTKFTTCFQSTTYTFAVTASGGIQSKTLII